MKRQIKSASDTKVGDIFDRLTILEIDKRSYGNIQSTYFAYVECKCGNKDWKRLTLILRREAKSCGCMKNERISKVNDKGHYYDISYGDLLRLERTAKKTGKEFDITAEYVWDVWVKQGKRCAISGAELVWKKNVCTLGATASIDRIDNSKGYIKGNIQILHSFVNMMKKHHRQEDLIEWCHIISEYNRPRPALSGRSELNSI